MPFIPLEVFSNNPSTTVNSGGTTAPAGGTVESWTVASSAGWPVVEIGATQFHVADPAQPSEPMTVTNVSGTTWTVVRGAESSAPVAHQAGFTVVQVVTAGALAGMQYPAWQFPVQAYGAQGDGKIGAGGTGASGQNVFTDAGASFVNATAPAGDVGKVIVINQGTGSATVGTNPFCGTITAVNNATSVTLSGNLAATCAAAPYCYGTDDAAAINAAMLAASQWAVTTGNYKAQVMFEPQLYMLGALVQSTAYGFSPFNTGVNYTYNTHIPVPFTTQYGRKLIIDLIGTGDSSDPDFWGAAIPSVQGTCLVSAVFNSSQPNGTFGQMSVIGAPSAQTNIGNGGITGGGFANVLVNVDGITVVTPFNTQQYSFDFRYAAQANVINAAAVVFAPVNFGGQTVGGPWIRSTNLPSNVVAVGLAMPLVQNNDNCNVGLFVAEGIAIGTLISEHFTAQRVCHIFCNRGFQVSISGGTTPHGGTILYWSPEGCDTGIYSNASIGNTYPIFIGLADFEPPNTYYFNDANGNLTGTVYWYDTNTALPGAAGMLAPNLNIVNLQQHPGPWSGAPAAPASATAQQNTSFRPATVYASAATSITNTATGPASTGMTALGQAAGAGVAVPVRVPSGHWYSVTFTGALTTKWVLE